MKYAAALLLFFLSVDCANAWYHPVVAPVVRATTVTPPPAASGLSSGSSRFVCWLNPAGFLICATVVAIGVRIHQEIQMGCTRDPVRWPPKFWMPLCGWKDPMVASRRPISTRG